MRTAALVALAVMISGCGGNASPSSPGAGSPSEPTPQVTQAAGYAAGTDCTVQTGGCSSYHITLQNAVGAGHTIVLVFWWNTTTTPPPVTVSDSTGDTYTPVFSSPVAAPPGGNDFIWVYYAHNVLGGNTTATVDVGTANADQFSIAALELNGDYTPDVFTSSSAVAPNQSGSPSGPEFYSSGTITTTFAKEVLIGFGDINDPDPTLHGPAPISAGTDYTEQYSSNYFAVESESVSSIGQYQATLTTPVPTYWGTVGIVTFH